MAITLETSGSALGPNTGTATVTVSITVPDSKNMVLVVASSSYTNRPLTAWTYGGVALTSLVVQSSSYYPLWIHYMINPPVGTANLIVTGTSDGLKMVVYGVYSGVDLLNPFGNPVNSTTNYLASSPWSQSVSGLSSDDVLFDAATFYYITTTIPTAGGGLSAIANVTSYDYASPGYDGRLIAGNLTADASSESPSWTWSGGNKYCQRTSFRITALVHSYTSQYPPAQSDTYIKATSTYSVTYYAPYFTTDPTKSLIGISDYNEWLSGTSATTNQRFHFDLGSPKVVRRLYYENAHSNGGTTTSGGRAITIQGSNSPTAFSTLTYATDTDWEDIELDDYELDQHVASNVPDPKYILLNNASAYRYYAIKIATNWGHATYMSVRRLELQTEDGFTDASGTIYPIIGNHILNGSSYENNAYDGFATPSIGTSSTIRRAILKFNMPYTSSLLSCDLSLISQGSTSSQTYYVYRLLKNITKAVTWNKYDGVNAWATPGGMGTGDIDPTALGSVASSGTGGVAITIPLNITEIKKMMDGTYNNYGFLVASPGSNVLTYYNYNYTTLSYRPQLSLTYGLETYPKIIRF